MRKKILWRAGILFISVVIHLQLWSQKKWDGGGGDSLWNNAMNWHPNGIPTESDTVVLDNQWISNDYVVYLPDSMISSHAFSISILPSIDQQIQFVLPASNTASPGLTLSSPFIAIEIQKGGSFYNNSGATAGNPISLLGKIKIMNGGRYFHQTQRGNALLISNLVANSETRTGIFEFNVPGNSAYTISASGRIFGSLVLNGQQTTRKTYTCSGSNKMTIEGDLIIQEQAGLSSSLTNTISIGGDLQVKGRLYLNPVSGDSLGREMVTNGPANRVIINGQFNQGIHFRKWIIEGRYVIKDSNIQLDQASSQIQIKTAAQIDMGNSIVRGLGKLIIDSNVHLYTSAPSIIGSDSLSNIQLSELSIPPSTKFTVYGEYAQKTGDRFPNVISSLSIHKPIEKLTLSNSLTINDSLLLSQGKIVLDDSIAIAIMLYTDQGNENSYVDGRLIQKSNKSTLYFPLGIDSLFSPAQINRLSTTLNEYEVSVKRFNLGDNMQHIQSPIYEIGSPVYWKVNIPNSSAAQEHAQLELTNKQHYTLTTIIQYDTVFQKWTLASKPIHTTNPINLVTDTLSRLEGLFTIGLVEPAVLALNSITLSKTNNIDDILLKWIVNDDENASFYTLEANRMGRNFKPIDTIVAVGQKGKHTYYTSLKRRANNPLFIRICGTDEDGNNHYSNIVYDQGLIGKLVVYPNPTSHQLTIKTMEKVTSIVIIDSKGSSLLSPFHADKTNYIVSVKQLKPGNYYLRLYYSNGTDTISFIKQ